MPLDHVNPPNHITHTHLVLTTPVAKLTSILQISDNDGTDRKSDDGSITV